MGIFLQKLLKKRTHKIMQFYIQPYLADWLDEYKFLVVGGVGGLMIGGYFLVQDWLGGTASKLAVPAEKKLGGAYRANQIMYQAAALIASGVAAALFFDAWIVGVIGFILLTVLQNVRRPIFVAQFNEVMDKPQRATTLSIESQARSWMVAALMPISGYMAERYGPKGAFITIAAVLVAGLVLYAMPRGVGASESSKTTD